MAAGADPAIDRYVEWLDRNGLARRMTLADAQAVRCNGCGDCCDSARAGRIRGGRIGFGWGRSHPAGPMIVPLRECAPGVLEADVPRSYAGVEAFRCSALARQGDGTALCSLWDSDLRPQLCGDFPVYGAHAGQIRGSLADPTVREVVLPYGLVLSRCAWAGVIVVRDPVV